MDNENNEVVEETTEQVQGAAISPEAEDMVARIQETVDDALATTQRQTLSLVNEALREATQPRVEDRPPVRTEPRQEAQPSTEVAQARVVDMRDGRYRDRPTWEQRVRDPQLDELLQRWILSKHTPVANRDQEDRLFRQINREYGQRADLLIGAPDIPPVFTGTGGPNIPAPLAAMITAQRDAISKMRSQGFTTQSATSKVSRLRCRGLVQAGMVSEGATGVDGTPAYDEVLVNLQKCQTQFNTSREQLMFSPFNLVSDFISGAGAAFGRVENVQIATSNGTAPNVSESIESVNMTSAPAFGVVGTLTYQELVKIYYSLPEEYRDASSGCAWWGNSNVLSFMSQLVDGNSRPIFQGVDSAANALSETDSRQIGNIMGLPVHELPFGTDVLYLGRGAAFMVWDQPGMTVDNSEHTRWAEDTWVWKVTEFFDFHGLDYGSDASANPINGWRVTAAITGVA